MNFNQNFKERIYLPSTDQGIETQNYLKRYIEREFPKPKDGKSKVYCIPQTFQKSGEKQGTLAEFKVFNRFSNVGSTTGLWMLFFHDTFYGGHSFRNQRVGKVMIREHDFVVFAINQKKHFVAFVEVKSTNDHINTLEKISDSRVIKNNKRSAQHQLRDHFEVLEAVLGKDPKENGIKSYIMWPFLSSVTKDSKQRWKEDGNLHVFEDTISDQKKFDNWLYSNFLQSGGISEDDFNILLNRFVILSCGVFVEEINKGLMALLTQEQLHLLNSDVCQQSRALVVHGAAGTGKTLLVLRKLERLHQEGKLNEKNRALYICYWPGIRMEMELKLETLGIREYVDTARFFVSLPEFLKTNNKSYKHIFMDEAEAICLAFERSIMTNTLEAVYKHYHHGNCQKNCSYSFLEDGEDISRMLKKHHNTNQWGELWFMVDINQASLFLPKHSPQMLKTPSLLLSKVMRSTGYIFDVFKQFYSLPMPLLPKKILANVNIPDITLGHHVFGPPVYWADSQKNIDQIIAKIIIDLCSTKGFKPNDLCVIPFLVNERLIPESVNKCIDELFVENAYRPSAVKDVEHFLKYREINNFLISWALRVKGLEFKVVIMAIDDDDFDGRDSEDRKKAYIIASRCTSMLILVSTEAIRQDMDSSGIIENYPFCIKL